jgi:GntR family transcriptional regulator
MRRHDLVAKSRILEQTKVRADDSIADALRVPAKSPILMLKRLRLAGGSPMSVQTAYIPCALVPGLKVGEENSLYELLQTDYDLYPARARETYFASLAESPTAELLTVTPGSPVFAVERVTLLPNEKPFEFVRSIVRGDLYKIVLDLVKQQGSRAFVPRAIRR